MNETAFVFPNDVYPPWSIMIVLYPYITGLVAGAFVVSALYHVFHRQALKPVARLALVTSLCFCAFATLPLLLHLHHPERCFNVMITPSGAKANTLAPPCITLYYKNQLLVQPTWAMLWVRDAARVRNIAGDNPVP